MAVFSAIHISDLHFGADPRQSNFKTFLDHHRAQGGARGLGRSARGIYRQTTHDPDIAASAAKFLLDRFSPRLLLLLSGDIAATGMELDLKAAFEFLDGPAGPRVKHMTAALSATIADGHFDVFLVPGNHDRYIGNTGMPGGTAFDRLSRHHWGNPNPRVVTRIVEDDETGSHLAIVAADMCLPRSSWFRNLSASHYGQGQATTEVVALLCHRTDELRRDYENIGVCWMIHFPPTLNAGDVSDELKLIDSNLVEQAANKCDIRLIISGHIHRPSIFRAGSLEVECAGSATCYLEAIGNYIHYIEIDVTSGVATLSNKIDFKWNRRSGGFEEI